MRIEEKQRQTIKGRGRKECEAESSATGIYQCRKKDAIKTTIKSSNSRQDCLRRV